MKTRKLILDRWLGHAQSEDYIAWAGELLVEGRDSPYLRILAGELPTEWQDIEKYFLLACKELNLQPLKEGDNPRDAVPLVKQLYQSGMYSPNETLRIMSNLYERSDYSDPFLSLWFGVEDEFFPEVLESLEQWIDREWRLFDRAAGLDIPGEFYRFGRCGRCRHIGLPAHVDYDNLHALTTQGYAATGVCAKCGASGLRSMAHAGVQEDYFSRLRGA